MPAKGNGLNLAGNKLKGLNRKTLIESGCVYGARVELTIKVSAMRKLINVLIFVLIASFAAIAGNSPTERPNFNPLQLSSEKFALLHGQDTTQMQKPALKTTAVNKKSGVKAAFLSAFIPGAGEVYAKSYWKAAIFAALEIGLWTANVVYNNKGDDEDSKMRQYGDAHWSPKVYWSYVYKKAVDQGLWSGQTLNGHTDAQGRFVLDDQYFNQDLIRELYPLQDDLGFTHQLPLTKTQQYYEMIYKYLGQFGVGWDDVYQTFNDPYYYEIDSHLGHLTPNISKYRSMRNLSNHYYDVATTMMSFVLANHLLSAFDAAWTVKKYNVRVSQAVRVKPYGYGWPQEPVVVYGLNIQW